MDTGTLIDVVAMIDARIAVLEALADSDIKHARLYELQQLSNYLQKGIEAGVSKAEDAIGAGE
jgi:hypothetical protein